MEKELGLENFLPLIGIIAAVIIVVVSVIARKKYVHKREVAQFLADEAILLHRYHDLDADDIRTYMELPNRKSRMEWLKRHHPDFVTAAERHYKNGDLEGVAAIHLDLRLIKNAFTYRTRDAVIRTYQTDSYRKSLNEYQELVDARNVEDKKEEDERRQAEAKARAVREERLAKERAEAKVRKEAAKTYWDSLSTEQKAAFKKAQGSTERQKALPSATNSAYSVDALYPFIMANEFSNISTSTGSSIDYCESPSFTHSSYDGGGSHYSDGGGSTYSDGGSTSCDSGGGVGGE